MRWVLTCWCSCKWWCHQVCCCSWRLTRSWCSARKDRKCDFESLHLSCCCLHLSAAIWSIQLFPHYFSLFFNCACFKHLFSFLGKAALSFSEGKFLTQNSLWLRFRKYCNLLLTWQTLKNKKYIKSGPGVISVAIIADYKKICVIRWGSHLCVCWKQ